MHLEPSDGAPASSGPAARVVLIGEDNAIVGSMAKIDAHQSPGRWHLAFSAFLFNADGLLLVQRRAHAKYHFAGRWANSCCGHLAPGERLPDAANARVFFELGMETELAQIGTFRYVASDPVSSLVERELDTVLIGYVSDGVPSPNSDEVSEVKWVHLDWLRSELERRPDAYVPWLGTGLEIAVLGASRRVTGGGRDR